MLIGIRFRREKFEVDGNLLKTINSVDTLSNLLYIFRRKFSSRKRSVIRRKITKSFVGERVNKNTINSSKQWPVTIVYSKIVLARW